MNTLTLNEATELIIEQALADTSNFYNDSAELLESVKNAYEFDMDKMGLNLEKDFTTHPFEVFNEAMGQLLIFSEKFS